MRRMVWLGVGLAVGALVVRAATKKMEAYTPKGIAASARGSAAGMIGTVRSLVEDIREGMAEREAQIQEAFIDGVTVDGDWTGDDLGGGATSVR